MDDSTSLLPDQGATRLKCKVQPRRSSVISLRRLYIPYCMTMASTNTSSAANSGSTGFAGDDFANNLFSDLAPLLTLFGEQVTKQFLSLSIGWADNFMLAMAPLGILTIVVSAIRVTKDRMLKALVGRSVLLVGLPNARMLLREVLDIDCFVNTRLELVRLVPLLKQSCCRPHRTRSASYLTAMRSCVF